MPATFTLTVTSPGALGPSTHAMAVLLASCTQEPANVAPPSAKPLVVQIAKAEPGDIIRRIRLPGSLRANQEVRLHAKANGFVKTITKDRGDGVKAGEVVATLEIPELATDLDSARALFAIADSTVKRLEKIRAADVGAVPEQDLEVERAKRAAAEATRKRVEAMIAYTEIKAPFDGVITERHVDLGALVQQGAIVTLIDRSKLRLIVDVPEAEVRFVLVGSLADVTLEAIPGKVFPMAVKRTANRLDADSRTLRIELESEPGDPAMAPGMYAAVALALERHRDVLCVPAKSLAMEQGKPCVYTLVDGKAHKAPVTTGIGDGMRTEIASGLANGDFVIIPPGPGLVRDGLAVQAAEQK